MIQSISAHATIFFFFLTILETDIKKKKQTCKDAEQVFRSIILEG